MRLGRREAPDPQPAVIDQPQIPPVDSDLFAAIDQAIVDARRAMAEKDSNLAIGILAVEMSRPQVA